MRWAPWVAALAVLVIVSLLVVGQTERRGTQTPSPEIRIGAAPSDGWRLLEGETLRPAGFPEPMIRRAGGELCFGFSRVDYAVPRPSLARCADEVVPAADALMVLTTITSGADRWHVLVFGEDIRQVHLTQADGQRLDAAGVHRLGSVAAVRLPIDATVSAVEWKTRTASYRCDPQPDVVVTATWCIEPA